MAKLGIRQFNDLIGRSDLLDMRDGIEHWKARGLDFARVFYQPKVPAEVARYHCEAQDHGLTRALDHELIAESKLAIEHRRPMPLEHHIPNANPSLAAMLSCAATTRSG